MALCRSTHEESVPGIRHEGSVNLNSVLSTTHRVGLITESNDQTGTAVLFLFRILRETGFARRERDDWMYRIESHGRTRLVVYDEGLLFVRFDTRIVKLGTFLRME